MQFCMSGGGVEAGRAVAVRKKACDVVYAVLESSAVLHPRKEGKELTVSSSGVI